MTRQRRDYLSYLLRIWRTGNESDAVWRASIENPFNGERQAFASLQDLCAFLQIQIDTEEDDDELKSHGGKAKETQTGT